jgi:hypothetical protein
MSELWHFLLGLIGLAIAFVATWAVLIGLSHIISWFLPDDRGA